MQLSLRGVRNASPAPGSDRVGAPGRCDPEIGNIRADELQGDYPAVQYVPPEGPFRIDILTRLGEAFRFEELETERVKFEELTVTVVTPRMLYRMKMGTIRLRDRADAELLRERFKLEED